MEAQAHDMDMAWPMGLWHIDPWNALSAHRPHALQEGVAALS